MGANLEIKRAGLLDYKLDKRERLLQSVDWAFVAGLFPFFDMVLKENL